MAEGGVDIGALKLGARLGEARVGRHMIAEQRQTIGTLVAKGAERGRERVTSATNVLLGHARVERTVRFLDRKFRGCDLPPGDTLIDGQYQPPITVALRSARAREIPCEGASKGVSQSPESRRYMRQRPIRKIGEP